MVPHIPTGSPAPSHPPVSVSIYLQLRIQLHPFGSTSIHHHHQSHYTGRKGSRTVAHFRAAARALPLPVPAALPRVRTDRSEERRCESPRGRFDPSKPLARPVDQPMKPSKAAYVAKQSTMLVINDGFLQKHIYLKHGLGLQGKPFCSGWF